MLSPKLKYVHLKVYYYMEWKNLRSQFATFNTDTRKYVLTIRINVLVYIYE